jgi:hypothetical protein
MVLKDHKKHDSRDVTKVDRHPMKHKNGEIVARPKKDGHSGKGGWGKAGSKYEVQVKALFEISANYIIGSCR